MRYLLFLFLFTSSLVYSQEKYVSIYGNDNSGDGTKDNPYRSINKALDNLSSGHIFIRQGRYREKVVINEKTNKTINFVNFRIQLFQIVLFYYKVLKFIYIKINAKT